MKLKHLIKKNLSAVIIVTLMFQLSFINSVNAFAEENVIKESITEDQITIVELSVNTEPVLEEIIKTPTTTQENSTNTESISNATSSPIEVFISTSTILGGVLTESTTTEILASSTLGYENTENSTTINSTTTITTGESVALANILNIVNTNLINSTGSIVLANVIEDYDGPLDFRTNPISTSTESRCTLTACNGIDSIKVKIEAEASIDNLIIVDAVSGINKIENAENAENAVISTGDVTAGLNLINVANTNFIDSNYLLLSLNSFVDINNDIIFPSLTNFFSAQDKISQIENENKTMNNTQIGNISNDLDISANTGNNEGEQLGSSIIKSGDSISSTNIYNNINSLLIGGNTVSIFLKVTGAWTGKLFGTPSENTFIQDNNLYTLNFNNNVGTLKNLNTLQEIDSTTTANIYNTVHVLSDSGNNSIENSSTSLIQTGAARTSANIINIANSNIIGKNWILAIINIFGDFNGNILFGVSDLWLGQKVVGESYIDNGTLLTYTLTAINKGDSNASNVFINSKYNNQYLDIIDSSIPYSEDELGNLKFNMSNIEPNQVKEIIYHARIKNTTPGTKIINTSTISGLEPENTTNNTDTTTIVTSYPASGGGSYGPVITPQILIITIPNTNIPTPNLVENKVLADQDVTPNVNIIRETSEIKIVGSESKGGQILIIQNMSRDTLPGVKFDDILYDKDGNKIQTESWDIGDLLPNEEIRLTYNVSFKSEAIEGDYFLSSQLTYSNGNKLDFTKNGKIIYIIPAKNIPILSNNTQIISRASPKKVTVLGTFISSILPETAYAEELGKSQEIQSVNKNNIFYLIGIIFLVLSAWYIYNRQKQSNIRADYTILS